MKYTPGMTLAEFEQMVAKHTAKPEPLRHVTKRPCTHPFTPAAMNLSARRDTAGDIVVEAVYRCIKCSEKLYNVKKRVKKVKQ